MTTHLKGAPCPAHDIRGSWEIMFNCLISGSAGAFQGQGVDGWGPEPDVGFPGPCKPFDEKRPPHSVRAVQYKKQFEDACGVCGFAHWWVPGSLPYLAEMLSAVTGWNVTREEAQMIGDRITNVQRIYNMRRGMTRKDDLDIGPRLLEAPQVGPAKGHPMRPDLIEKWVTEYYRLMGWDEVTGKPLDETVRRLGLEEYAKLLK